MLIATIKKLLPQFMLFILDSLFFLQKHFGIFFHRFLDAETRERERDRESDGQNYVNAFPNELNPFFHFWSFLSLSKCKWWKNPHKKTIFSIFFLKNLFYSPFLQNVYNDFMWAKKIKKFSENNFSQVLNFRPWNVRLTRVSHNKENENLHCIQFHLNKNILIFVSVSVFFSNDADLTVSKRVFSITVGLFVMANWHNLKHKI